MVGRAITLEREPSKNSKELISKRMQKGLIVITLQGAILEKIMIGWQQNYFVF
jgi:hypothetical protein